MNRFDARRIAETITNEQLQIMFDQAKAKIVNWAAVSNVNKGITKGTSWNILAQTFNTSNSYHILAKTNMVREFGEFLPKDMKPKKKTHPIINPVHQIPKFLL